MDENNMDGMEKDIVVFEDEDGNQYNYLKRHFPLSRNGLPRRLP